MQNSLNSLKSTQAWIVAGIIIVLTVAFLAWLIVESSKPLPGQKIADLGREHVPLGTKVEYNSHPPTSGKHYSDWIRAGVYEDPKDDRNLVHSLEHGYIIMSYKCNLLQTVILEGAPATDRISGDSIASPSASLQNDKECNQRKDQLAKVYDKKGKRKLIVVPRPNLDTTFALTVWTYIFKFDQFDADRIEKFIDAHLNQGPEKTME